MKRERSGVNLLLGGLLIFSLSIGALYSNKKIEAAESSNQSDAYGTLTPEQMIQELSIFIQAKSLHKIIAALDNLPADKALRMLKLLVQQTVAKENSLTRDELVTIIYGTALHYPNSKDVQYSLLDLMLQDKLILGTPLVYVAVANNFPQIVPVLLSWIADRQVTKSAFSHQLSQPVKQSYGYALNQNKLQEFKSINSAGASITPELATDLLWMVVNKERSPEFAKFLIDSGAALDKPRSGYTLLMKAVQKGNMPLVKVLVEAMKQKNIDINTIINPAVGSALQIAMAQNNLPIDLYLREQGARE